MPILYPVQNTFAFPCDGQTRVILLELYHPISNGVSFVRHRLPERPQYITGIQSFGSFSFQVGNPTLAYSSYRAMMAMMT